MKRPRLAAGLRQLAAAALIIVVGLVWRMAPLGLSGFVRNYGGGVLWGAMLMLIVGAVMSGWSPARRVAVVAGLIALATELFRRYHAPALDAFRLTLPGTLLLGRIFNPWNVLAYWLGIAAAIPLRRRLIGLPNQSSDELNTQ